MTRRGGWCMAAPGARKAHELCRYTLCVCDCHEGPNPNEIRDSAVESGTVSGPASTVIDRGLDRTNKEFDR